LNPKLAAYPSFVSGEAVRSQLSPDGGTLAILCAGMNSLIKPDGTTDTAASTQFLFIYDVSGSHREAPLLKQVIPQTNAHVGLVFAPLIKRIHLDGNALGMTLDHSGARLFVAQDNADQVAVIDTASNKVIATIDARGPPPVSARAPLLVASRRSMIMSRTTSQDARRPRRGPAITGRIPAGRDRRSRCSM
jgi:YVTN family beta-propeller protein